MATIIPFKAVRPTQDKVSLVTSRSYEDYSSAELASQLDFNPFSFLHVLNPSYVNQHKIGFEKRFKLVAQKYHDFKNENILEKDSEPSIYIYQIDDKLQSFTGIVAATSIEDYQKNIIKKHEDTLQYRVELFKDYLHTTGFNTEPVLMAYPENVEIQNFIDQQKQLSPIYEFSTTKKEKHTVWMVNDPEKLSNLIQVFDQIENLYIADGHHRSASAEKLFVQDQHTQNVNLNYFMSFLICETNVKIYEYNRLIRGLNNFTKESFLEQLAENFWIKNKAQELYKPQKKFDFGMYLDNEFYSLQYKFVSENTDILENLDAQILYQKVLKPILGIEDLRNDERIEYISGKQSLTTLKEIVDEGEFDIAFTLFPSNISEIKNLADNQLIMPPKSTYIDPKFRSGLFVYEL